MTDAGAPVELRERSLAAGLLVTTLATLLVELLDTRLLSVLTWYHLSFLAVSLAMLGTAAGAVAVFLAEKRLAPGPARAALVPFAVVFALAIVLTHVLAVQLRIPPMDARVDLASVVPLTTAILVLTVPFVLAGVTVTIALTRAGGRIGVLYGADLLGAATGSVLLVPLLARFDLVSAALVAAAVAATGGIAFAHAAGRRLAPPAAVAALCALGALAHAASGAPITVRYPHGTEVVRADIDRATWNAYSYVVVRRPAPGVPFFWGRGRSPDGLVATTAMMSIDGSAGTPLTQWDGNPGSLGWVQYDVTALPYHLRAGGVAGIIGVGGGRDVLTALWAGSRGVTGIEVNGTFLDIVERSHRGFANFAGRPEVRLVHDEARSYLTRSPERFDVLQMSLIDTWAATGAGAFTLTENGLYTVEAWRVFLSRLAPGGLFSTSRWFAPAAVSETSRLLSLAIAALLDRGVTRPADHVALVAQGLVATLLVGSDPLSAADVKRLGEVADRLGFQVLVAPGQQPANVRLARIVASTSRADLDAATADPDFDYGPPTDERPYFFNMLKPRRVLRLLELPSLDVMAGGGVLWGNMRATGTLIVLVVVATVLALGLLVLPLAARGLPAMPAGRFAVAMGYFALIGYGFMSVQLAFLQRFSPFLGHPIYAYAVILATMIAAAGVGSMLSERVALGRDGRWHWALPCTAGAFLLVLTVVLDPVLAATLSGELATRCLTVVALTAPVSALLGFCFPFGVRLASPLARDALPWMWAVNGATSVVASILAVMISMWAGISVNLLIGATLYFLLALPARALARAPAAAPAAAPERAACAS